MSDIDLENIPSVESIEWFRNGLDEALKRLEAAVDKRPDNKEALRVLRMVRMELLRPTDGCVVTIFDPRIRRFSTAVDDCPIGWVPR